MAQQKYRVQCLDAEGQAVTLDLPANDADDARAQASARGLWVMEVGKARFALQLGGARTPRLGGRRISRYIRLLSSLLVAGLTVEQALLVLADDGEDPVIRNLALAMRDEIRGGASLAQAFARQGNRFPRLCRAVIHAGELSGRLPQVMERLADHFEARGEVEGKVITAMIYPIIVAIVAVLIVSGLMLWVVPQMVNVFAQRAELPLATRILLQISHAFKIIAAPLSIAGIAALTLFSMALKRTPALVLRFAQFRLGWPLWGKLEKLADTARFASTLSILSGSGVGMIAALEAASEVMGNRRLQVSVQNATEAVKSGASLSRALQVENVFPPVLVHMVRSGEATGNLSAMLERASHQMNRELENRVNVVTGLLGPGMVLVMGLMVLFIVMAILMPIFEINDLVK